MDFLPNWPWYLWLLLVVAVLWVIGIADSHLMKRYRVVELPEEIPADENRS